jgi:hypothetical protein
LPLLLAATEHLGELSSYSLTQYLAIGQFDGGLTADEIFQVIHTAIFIHQVGTGTTAL